MATHHSFGKNKSPRIGRYIVLVVIIALVRIGIALTNPISLDPTVIVKKGDTLNAFLQPLAGREKIKINA